MSDVQLEDLEKLIKTQKSILLATVSSQGEAHISYAPHIIDQGHFYIFVSRLAAHTSHLLHHPRAQIMLIQDECKVAQIYGRQRLTYSVQASVIERETAEFDRLLDLFEDRFGNIIKLLREQCPDFEVFCLTPDDASWVAGFARAFKFNPNDPEFVHITGKNYKDLQML